jgi:putative phosphoribosyl transferase
MEGTKNMLLQRKELVRIATEGGEIEGSLEMPEHAIGLVIFAHGSGSSRFSHRNNYVAGALHASGIGSLLLDLLTNKEDDDVRNRFDIHLLTLRLAAAHQWAQSDKQVSSLPIALFGASTGAAAALELASLCGESIAAVVSRGGRPDLASNQVLENVKSPTLLIVGGDDAVVLDMNREAFTKLHCKKRLEIVKGATHLFEESGKLQTVAALAVQWFHWNFSERSKTNQGNSDAQGDPLGLSMDSILRKINF